MGGTFSYGEMKLPLWIIAGLLACQVGMAIWDHRPRQRLPADVMAQSDVKAKVDQAAYQMLIEREAEHQTEY